MIIRLHAPAASPFVNPPPPPRIHCIGDCVGPTAGLNFMDSSIGKRNPVAQPITRHYIKWTTPVRKGTWKTEMKSADIRKGWWLFTVMAEWEDTRLAWSGTKSGWRISVQEGSLVQFTTTTTFFGNLMSLSGGVCSCLRHHTASW
jgi:hypothetical protein